MLAVPAPVAASPKGLADVGRGPPLRAEGQSPVPGRGSGGAVAALLRNPLERPSRPEAHLALPSSRGQRRPHPSGREHRESLNRQACLTPAWGLAHCIKFAPGFCRRLDHIFANRKINQPKPFSFLGGPGSSSSFLHPHISAAPGKPPTVCQFWLLSTVSPSSFQPPWACGRLPGRCPSPCSSGSPRRARHRLFTVQPCFHREPGCPLQG